MRNASDYQPLYTLHGESTNEANSSRAMQCFVVGKLPSSWFAMARTKALCLPTL
jgi:hypothetical protein